MNTHQRRPTEAIQKVGTISAAIIHVEDRLRKGDLDAAKDMLDGADPGVATPSQRRHIEHLNARVRILEGDYDSAIELLERAIETWGSHVGALSDLASCYYMSGRTLSWSRAVNRLEKEFSLAHDLLSPASSFRTCMTLGKFMEEKGAVAKALEWYEIPLRDKKLSDERCFRIFCQQLRLNCFLGRNAQVSRFHTQLTTLLKTSSSPNFSIEVEHALMLSESALFGFAHGETRLRSLLKRNLDSGDRRLVIFDFIEEAIAQGEAHRLEALAPELEPLISGIEAEIDAFERLVLLAWKRLREGMAISVADIVRSERDLPMTCQLRLFALLLKTTRCEEEKEEARRHLSLSLNDLDKESCQILSKKWKSLLTTDEVHLLLEVENRRLIFGGKSMDLSRKKVPLQILGLLAERREATLEEAVKIVWSGEFNESYYHRLRICVQRMNSDLQKFTSSAKLIEVDSESIKLRSGIELRRSRL